MRARCEIDGLRDVYCKTHAQHWIHCVSALEAEHAALTAVVEAAKRYVQVNAQNHPAAKEQNAAWRQLRETVVGLTFNKGAEAAASRKRALAEALEARQAEIDSRCHYTGCSCDCHVQP